MAIIIAGEIQEIKIDLDVYGCVIGFISINEPMGFTMLESLLKKQGPLKETIINCMNAFRQSISREVIKLILQYICCPYINGPHWDPISQSLEEDGEFQITCTKCSIKVKIFKLRHNIP